MIAKQNLWMQKKKKIVLLIAAVMVIVFIVSFVSFFKTDEEKVSEEYKPYDSMYNASRYFFRVFYPDDWDVNADPYGFLIDEEGLVLEIFPLKKILSTPSATGESTSTSMPVSTSTAESTASATVDPRAGMERNSDLTIKFYYKQYNNAADATAKTEPSATPASKADDKKAPVELVDLADCLFDEFKLKNKDSELKYKFDAAKTYKGDTVDYCVLPYTYVKDDIKMSGEMYVASRAMAYYVIYVDGTSSAFTKYNTVFENILYNLKFSVFDY